MTDQSFRAAGYAWRLYAGPQVIEQSLTEAVTRAGAKRAFVVCSPSVNGRTDIVRRIEAAIGDRYAGVYDGIKKDSTYASVLAAKHAATEASADLLIAVGGGSVIVATRAVAIFMAEPGDPFQIMTQYPEGKPAYSPRLLAPKPPIVNIPTTPNSAMNRAGTGLKNPDLDHRMEYFDPKTRPHSIFLDNGALLSAPPELIRSTATTVFAGLVGSMAQLDMNPLAHGDRDHAFRLAFAAYPRLVDELDNPSLRIDLCIAAFLQNRAEDDGSRRFRGGAFSGNYAVSTALHVRYPHVGQGEFDLCRSRGENQAFRTGRCALGAPCGGSSGSLAWQHGRPTGRARRRRRAGGAVYAHRRADAVTGIEYPPRRPSVHRQ